MLRLPPTSPGHHLFDDGPGLPVLPVCDHYCGTEARMRKALQRQAECGPLFDVTLDNEDGAPVGGELDHAHLISSLLGSALNRWDRVGVRLLDPGHARFEAVAEIILQAPRRPAFLMIPKIHGTEDLDRAARLIDQMGGAEIPLHALIETHGALRAVHGVAAHPRIESLSFGLMDFVSAHRGAIPAAAMGVHGQFSHPLVLRAKLEIAAASHAHGKIPSHCVVTEFKDREALRAAARQAREQLGYLRMWSIHPDQIDEIVAVFAPTAAEMDDAIAILCAAEAAEWGPVRYGNVLHDRASYRYYWDLVVRAHQLRGAGPGPLPTALRTRWLGDTA